MTAVGEQLPELVIDASVKNIVATAIASRDYQDVHHDIASAQERGSTTISTNILTSNGYLLRYVTDFFGKTLFEAQAPDAGVVLYVCAVPSMKKGDTIANVGVVASDGR